MANEPQLDYAKEAEEVTKGGDWLKLGVGIHKITPLQEIPPLTKKLIKGKEVEQTEILVEYNKERKKWSLNKAKSTKSLWGQVLVYAKHKGKITGEPMDVLVSESKDKNGEIKKDYKIIQVAELLQQQAKLATPQ